MKIYITEYARVVTDQGNASVGAPLEPAQAEQSFELGLVSEKSKPFGSSTRFVCIYSPVPIALAFGKDPEAVASLHVRSAGEHFYGVNPSDCVAAIMAEE